MKDLASRWTRKAFLKGLSASSRFCIQAQRGLAELAVAFHSPEMEASALALHYAGTKLYGSSAHGSLGLLPYEERMLARFFPAPPARLFLPAAGAGRALVALMKRGYALTAIEPSPSLAALSQRESGGGVAAVSIQQWAAQPSGTFDGIFTGWGLWLHLVQHEDRIRVLESFRRVCPRGPVLLSFWQAEPVRDSREDLSQVSPLFPPPRNSVQRTSRTFLRHRLLKRSATERGTTYSPGFFMHLVSERELREEAIEAGYEVAFYERDLSRYGHAVLLPSPSVGWRGR